MGDARLRPRDHPPQLTSRTWVGLSLILGVPPDGGRYCSYLLPMQDGGAFLIKVNPTQVRQEMGHPVVLNNNLPTA